MKPVLTAAAGVAIAATLAAGGFAQPQPNSNSNHRPSAYQNHRPPPYATQPPPGRPNPPPLRPPNSLGADWRLQQNEVRQGVGAGRLVPLAQVIIRLAQRQGGRELDAGLEYDGGRPIYRIRWMTRDGRRVDLLVDATTGGVLRGG